MPTALVLGATGATGKHILTELIANAEYTKVGEYGRRVTQFAGSPAKLVQHKIDFEKIEQAEGIKDGWDVVFIALGTTRAAAGSAEAFVKIDREYVLAAAAAAKSSDPTHKQRIVYVSAGGSSPTSPFLYPKSKGLTEYGLARLGYSDTIILRPAFLDDAQRADGRVAEKIFGGVVSFLGKFTDTVAIPVSELGKAAIKAGLVGTEKLPKEAAAYPVDVPALNATEQADKTLGPGKDAAKFTAIGNGGLLKLASH